MPGLASLSKSLIAKLGERKAQVCLLELDADDKPVSTEYIAFQYFPETITDTKAVNYETKVIPGGSLPLYQWTSSGERNISFEAVFTSDVDLAADKELFSKLVSKGLIKRNVDIRTALLWLRRYLLPRYEADQQVGVPLTQAPRKCILSIPNSGLGLTGGSFGTSTEQLNAYGPSVNGAQILADRLVCIMTQCDITYEAFFASGLPRVATVQLTFAQVAQIGGAVNFPRDSKALQDAFLNGSDEVKGLNKYPIKVKIS